MTMAIAGTSFWVEISPLSCVYLYAEVCERKGGVGTPNHSAATQPNRMWRFVWKTTPQGQFGGSKGRMQSSAV